MSRRAKRHPAGLRARLEHLESRVNPVRLPPAAASITRIDLAAAPDAPVWSALPSVPESLSAESIALNVDRFKPYALDAAALNRLLNQAPAEAEVPAWNSPSILELPTPTGSSAHFRIVSAPIMAPELSAKYPLIRTFRGQGIDDPSATLALDISPQGFRAQVLSPQGSWYIDPYYHLDTRVYAVYNRSDLQPGSAMPCLEDEDGSAHVPASDPASPTTSSMPNSWMSRSGTVLRTFRAAVAATGEYTAYQGGTVSAGLAAIVTAINRVSGVYETELSIRLTLVANNDLLVYTNASTDPYTNNSSSTLLSQNQSNVDAVIGNANYDIGHVFSTAGGGLASLGVVGVTGSKARGETGTSTPTGDGFYIDYVAHEMGHQFNAEHSFNGVNGSASGNRNAATAYEPGSASTIMGYAGICGADDLQSNSNAYFHSISFDEIIDYVDNSIPNVGVRTQTGNSVPTVNAGLDYAIPTGTPFTLTASGADANNDPLTYCWEERDLGAAQALSASDNGASPLVRSWNPTTSPSRTLPLLSNLLSNTSTTSEKLPALARTMKFRVTVRDNRAGGGGVNTDDMNVTVVNTGAAFQVTAPNTGVNWTAGSTQTVTWNVAGTTTSPISAANVAIKLSTDGGNTFPVTLIASTPNDGSENIVVPLFSTSSARIRVEPINNIFFDVSNVNFTITPSFNVTTTADSGPGSLRQAVLDANAFAGADTIGFDPTLFSTAQTITLTSGEIPITDSLTIVGPGSSLLTISGNSASRIFNIDSASAVLNVAINGATLSGGNGSGGSGGAIRVANERVTFDDLQLRNNTAGTNSGGALASGAGAAITLRRSTVSGNSANLGGGISFGSGGGLLLESSTLSGNSATITGGGLFFSGSVSADGLTIRNSTISANSAASGGGVGLNALVGTALIQNSTLTANSATTTDSTAGAGGGGIALAASTSSATLTLASTIVSGNTSANSAIDLSAVSAAIVNANFCAIGSASGFALSGSSGNNLAYGANLSLVPLANNGGITQTHRLGVGSPAINAGSNPASLTTDQRGTGFPRVVAGTADIGAVEENIDIPVAVAGSLPNVTTGGAASYSFTVTYSGTTAVNVATIDSSDIRVTGPNGFNQLATFVSASPNSNGSPIVATYSIPAPGGAFTGSANGTYTLALQANQVANTSGYWAAATSLGSFQVAIYQGLTVTNLNDSGAGSLRQAILDANASSVADTIAFAAGLTGTIALTSGQIPISDSVTIVGPGSSLVTVTGSNVSRIFNIDNATALINVTISGLTLTGGNGSTGSGGTLADGGAIAITNDQVTLEDVVISGCSAGGNDGGAIAISNAGFLTLRNSTISGCTGLNGGGIYFFSGGSLLVVNSTISGNTATNTSNTSSGGGGIYFYGTVGSNGFNIRNSTISGNSSIIGGGICFRSLSGTALIQNSTITANASTTTSTTAGRGGGGIALPSGSSGSVLTMDSTIVSGNTANAANGRANIASVSTPIITANYCAIGTSTGFSLASGSTNNLAYGALLNLGPLANNGGLTRTHKLGAGSLAINAGSNPAALTLDQRGTGYARVVGSAADIGAYEVQPAPRVSSVQMNAGAAQRSRVTSITITFNSIVNFAGSVAAAFQLSRSGTGGGTVGGFSATATTVNSATVVTLSNFTGAFTSFGSLANGFYNLTILASQVSNNDAQLDGTNSGTGGTNYQLVGSQSNRFFRYYGDVTGDGNVDGDDLAQFVATLFNPGNYIAAFDFDGNGSIDGDDLAQFVPNLFVPL